LCTLVFPLGAVREVCPNATDWPRIDNTVVLSPAGNVTVCGKSVAEWQALVPGTLANVSTGALPASLTAETIVKMARETLAGAAKGEW